MKETGRDKILKAFLENPRRMYLSEIARRAGVSTERAHTYLREMTESGYLRQEKKGNMSFYRPDFKNELLVKEFEFIELRRKQEFSNRNVVAGKLAGKLVELLKEQVPQLKGVFLFGSTARGESDEESDVDVLVVCENKNREREILEAARKASAQYGREVNASVVGEKEFARNLAEKTSFIKTLMRDKIILYGENWFYAKHGDKLE